MMIRYSLAASRGQVTSICIGSPTFLSHSASFHLLREISFQSRHDAPVVLMVPRLIAAMSLELHLFKALARPSYGGRRDGYVRSQESTTVILWASHTKEKRCYAKSGRLHAGDQFRLRI